MRSFLTIIIAFLFLHATAQDTVTYTTPRTEAQYPGGTTAWAHYLGKNLHYPDDAISNEIHGTIMVQFVVDTAGNISDVKAISGPTKGGLRDEAVRVITLSGKWLPAVQSGENVRSIKKVPIQFRMSFN